MSVSIINVDEKSKIPLYGVDFIGVIDRGTNVIEVKPITLCNLKCKYCFVSAGSYDTDFIVDPNYLLKKIRNMVEIKGHHKIEIHFAPYGEILLYPGLFDLIKELWNIKGIEIISLQTNGLLLNEDVIKQLEETKVTRINISLNSLNQEKANFLCNCENYNIEKLLNNILLLLSTQIDVLIAPVWFPGENDDDIEEIIKYVLKLRNKGFSEKKIQIGIQKYLIYKTGRKLKKIRPKGWDFFYKQLSMLEKKFKIKLKLGPQDFGIHKRKVVASLNLQKNDRIKLTIISKGRWKREYIGKLNNNFGIKVLLNYPIPQPEKLLGKEIEAKVIKANYKDNILTAYFSI
ncbi:MAG: molybdenum cofactor biosynthesis protein MoaA [Promethearchaeota archaeon Loki_b32]|nr:MAG: molybdenum cofactor biosynthesis protein MoaA [Candidatus Lokiarchaeota archaeon Loki_b32]